MPFHQQLEKKNSKLIQTIRNLRIYYNQDYLTTNIRIPVVTYAFNKGKIILDSYMMDLLTLGFVKDVLQKYMVWTSMPNLPRRNNRNNEDFPINLFNIF